MGANRNQLFRLDSTVIGGLHHHRMNRLRLPACILVTCLCLSSGTPGYDPDSSNHAIDTTFWWLGETARRPRVDTVLPRHALT